MNARRGHEVRLIGGQWKRSRLPVADRPGLRPSPDRVRETLFNWLGKDLGGWRVLDAFAGSGALGFEAASRGAAEVVLLERDAALVQSLRASRERLSAAMVQIHRADALGWMSRCAPARFDLVFLDPPFGTGLLDRAIALAAPLVAEGGFLYVESERPRTDLPQGFEPYREGRAGAVHHFLWARRYTAPLDSRGESP
ncbi:MAG TPA: 16S rRNA (guanine(966)-N(2))-methyltransferase RsmD [Rubrivivax sp.]|nr:16S rRNA (guanine(966)-N(2))-methyltransferase RsmD [Burkholderiales bacterium]HNU12504.1 16S rRNA (guanine(966)-N(2))-methyltransferase RsmD [Rubrivivax sp.]